MRSTAAASTARWSRRGGVPRAAIAALLCALLPAPGCRQVASYAAAPRDDLVGARDTGSAEGLDGTLDRAAPRDLAPDGCATRTIEVASALDDGEIWAGTFDSEGETTSDPKGIYIGYWGNDGNTWAFFRFVLPDLPRIDRVYLELWGLDTTDEWDPSAHALRVLLEDAIVATPPTTPEDAPDQPTGRPVLKAITQRWPESGGLAWQRDTYNRSPDLAPLVNSLGEDNGLLDNWPMGTVLQFWLRGDFATGSAEVATPCFEAFDHPARLVLFTCP